MFPLRLAALPDDIPEVAELDLKPIICLGDDLVVVDAKVRLTAARPATDPMRLPRG